MLKKHSKKITTAIFLGSIYAIIGIKTKIVSFNCMKANAPRETLIKEAETNHIPIDHPSECKPPIWPFSLKPKIKITTFFKGNQVKKEEIPSRIDAGVNSYLHKLSTLHGLLFPLYMFEIKRNMDGITKPLQSMGYRTVKRKIPKYWSLRAEFFCIERIKNKSIPFP